MTVLILSSPASDKVPQRNIASLPYNLLVRLSGETLLRVASATWYYTGYQPVPTTRLSHVRVALGSDCTCKVGVSTSSMSRPHLRWGMSKLALDDVPVWWSGRKCLFLRETDAGGIRPLLLDLVESLAMRLAIPERN